MHTLKSIYIRLFASLILFSAILIGVFSVANYRLSINTEKQQQVNMQDLIEDNVLRDMQKVDKAYLYFDESYRQQMASELRSLRDYYEVEPNIRKWDIQDIKRRTNMEFYVIDQHNKVILTTYPSSKGLDFNDCCTKFAALLDTRRTSDEFFSDGIDISVATSELWKYSYLSTSDHRYILELGVPLQDTQLYESFNFFDTMNALKEKYADLEDIRILNKEGYFLQSTDDKENYKAMSPAWRQTYEQTVATKKRQQFIEQLDDGEKMIHRFLPYAAEDIRGNSTERIIYTKYSNATEVYMRAELAKQNWAMVGLAIITSFISLMLILKIFTRPLQLATYDVLTGVHNRASYLQQMDQLLTKKRVQPIGLLLMDLDNFKLVNDQYGHPEGDEVLKTFAQILTDSANRYQHVVRFGGDEFGIIVERATEENLRQLSEKVMTSVRLKNAGSWKDLSKSIGGAIQLMHDETENSLYARADDALYKTKNAGKNGYTYVA